MFAMTGCEKEYKATDPRLIVELNLQEATLPVDDYVWLRATLKPENKTHWRHVEWVSSKPEVADVANGQVVAISEGNTVITVLYDGVAKAHCSIRVVGHESAE